MESGVPGGSGVRVKEMSRGKRAMSGGDEGGQPTPSPISETCPSCGCDAFDSLHSEPGELQRRQCKRCGEVRMGKWQTVNELLGRESGRKEEDVAKESFDCDQCDRKGFKHDQGLKHHKTTAHGKAKAVDLTKLPRHPNTTPTVREELLDTLSKRKAQLLAHVAEVDDVIDALEKAGR